ncbi:hypothetical protein B0T24DRAFT_618871 [Lasiosphaeria ovina]|uniref:F-box domain-containing protein n=1 Tax=Lasiosphaeria ovina TaxID=92902 RepID=A0AAE0KIC1_9PEZI|nr:hypothetical protein B0T24DRAFT_618871 [Lasiosphaeria ovina]
MSGLGTLSKVPAEVVENILDELCTHHVRHLQEYIPEFIFPWRQGGNFQLSNLASLARLCRVSKLFNEYTTWRLYHSLMHSRTKSKWFLIVRTLVTRRDLGGLVRHLALVDLKSDIPEDPALFYPEVLSYYTKQVALNPDCCLPPDALSLTDRNGSGGNAILATIISLCPNLSTLDLASYGSCTPCGFCSAASMLSLTGVVASFSAHSTNDWDDVESFLPLLRAAPNLRFLRFVDIGCFSLPEDLRLEHVANLDLQSCIEGDALAKFLQLCPNLQRLKYMYKEDSPWPDAQFRSAEAASTVLAHAPNLREFYLDLADLQSDLVDLQSDIADLQFDLSFLPMFEKMEEDEMRLSKELLEARGITCKFGMVLDTAGHLIYI